jgi:hypothetical protein
MDKCHMRAGAFQCGTIRSMAFGPNKLERCRRYSHICFLIPLRAGRGRSVSGRIPRLALDDPSQTQDGFRRPGRRRSAPCTPS